MNAAAPPPRAYLLAWSAYLLLVPFYFLGKTPVPGTQKLASGVPQVADYYLVAVMALVFLGLRLRLPRPAAPVLAAFGAFVGYGALVNGAWAVALEDASLLKNTLYYTYDALLLLTALALHGRFGDRFLRTTVYAVAASVFLQLLLSPFAPEPYSSRQPLFFNDENQLGYFCVLAATLFALGSRRFRLSPAFRLAFYGATGYLTLISQCRGALLGMATLAVVSQVGRPARLLLVLVGLAAVGLILTVDPGVVGKSGERLIAGGEYDSLATRGYDRLVNYPEYLFLGAGEGAYERFHSALYGSEIHSTLGSLLFCYGIIGAGCFLAGVFVLCRHDPRAALYLLPALVHGTGHQGLRFAFFWVMLGFLACTALEPVKESLPAPSQPPDGSPGEVWGLVS
jgi:hypothetical protein